MQSTELGASAEWRRILVADDSPMIGQMMRRLLGAHCAIVDVVEDGQAAVKATLEAYVFNRPYDAVLMDLHMPVMDGLTAIRLVRQAEYRGVIIAVTATDDERQSRLALDAGADDFVVKPVDGSQLCDRLRRLICPRA